MRTLRIASAVVVSAVLVGGLSACNSKSSSGNSASAPASAAAAPQKPLDLDPKSALLASAAVMEKLGSAKLAISEAGPKQNGTGTGSDIWKQPQAFEVTMTVEGAEMTMVSVDGTIYLKTPAAAQFGKKWVKFDSKTMSAMAKAGSAGDSLAGGVATNQQLANPALMLAATAQGGKLTKVGLEQVSGEQALHIKSTIQSDALVAGLTALSPDQQAVLKQELKLDGSTLVFDFWINGKNQLIQEKFNSDSGNAEDGFTIGYSDFGNAPAVAAPPAADVHDMAAAH